MDIGIIAVPIHMCIRLSPLVVIIWLLWLGRERLPLIWKMYTSKSQDEYLKWAKKYGAKHNIEIKRVSETSCALKEHGLDKNTPEELQTVFKKIKEAKKNKEKLGPGIYKVEFD